MYFKYSWLRGVEISVHEKQKGTTDRSSSAPQNPKVWWPVSRARGVGKGHTSTRREESWDGDESKPTRLRTVRTSWRACWRWLWLLFIGPFSLSYWSYNIWISLTFYVPETDSIKYFTFSMIISILGIWGILLNRRNIPIMSMPIESMLLAVNSNFLVFSVSSDDMMGQSFASLVPTVAAAESAIGLAIFVITFRVRGTIAVESINSIQG